MAEKCVFCKAEPKVIHFDTNMYYVHCSNPECKKHDKYAYLGYTAKSALEQWDFMNRPINRISSKKREKNDKNSSL